MATIFSAHWWVFVVRGILAILFAVATFVMPGAALLALVITFGVYAAIEGITALVAGVTWREGSKTPRWLLLLSGVVSIGAALAAFFVPGVTALALLYIIAARALVLGVLELVAAVVLRKEIDREWLLALSGVVSIAFGVLLAAYPGTGALAVVLWIGAYAFVAGVLLCAIGFKARGMERRMREIPVGPTPILGH